MVRWGTALERYGQSRPGASLPQAGRLQWTLSAMTTGHGPRASGRQQCAETS